MEQLLSVQQAADRLGGISKYSIQAWLNSGKLRRTKVGSRTLESPYLFYDTIPALRVKRNEKEIISRVEKLHTQMEGTRGDAKV